MAERDRSGDWRRGYDETVHHGTPLDTPVATGDYQPTPDSLAPAGVRGYGPSDQWGRSAEYTSMPDASGAPGDMHQSDEAFTNPPPDFGAPGGWGRSGGWHRGGTGAQRRRGPKGYKRSDDRITEDLCEHLMDISDIDSSEVVVHVQDGRVVLEGTVPERSMRYQIEDIAAQTFGVTDVENNIRVPRAPSA